MDHNHICTVAKKIINKKKFKLNNKQIELKKQSFPVNLNRLEQKTLVRKRLKLIRLNRKSNVTEADANTMRFKQRRQLKANRVSAQADEKSPESRKSESKAS